MEENRPFKLKFKMPVENIRIIEMGPADKQDRVMSTLAHAADIRDAHGKKNQRFHPR